MSKSPKYVSQDSRLPLDVWYSLLFACFRIQVEIVVGPRAYENTTSFHQSLDEFLSSHTAATISLLS